MALFNFTSKKRADPLEILKILGNQVQTQQQAGALQPGLERPDITAPTQGTGILPQNQAELISNLIATQGTEGVGQNQLNQLLTSAFSKGKPPQLKPGEISTLVNQAKPIRVAARDLRTNFDSMRSSFDASEGKGRAAADLAMVISFAKMLDPDSVVRSEEGETIQKTGGFFGVLRGMQDQIKGSGSLDQNARTGLMLEAGRQFQSRFGALAPDIEFFSSIAKNSGLPPSRLLTKDLLNPGERLTNVKTFLSRLTGDINTPNLPPGFVRE